LKIEKIKNMTSSETNDSNYVEVDGISVETLVPEQIVYFPKYGEETSLKLGVRITNKTSTPYRFDLPNFYPIILNPDREPMAISLNLNRTREVEDSDIPLIMPRESLDFLMDVKLSWYVENYPMLSGSYSYNCTWIFWISKPGKYQIGFKYRNEQITKETTNLQTETTEVGDFFIGDFQTDFIELFITKTKSENSIAEKLIIGKEVMIAHSDNITSEKSNNPSTELDGIVFKNLVSNNIVIIPKYRRETSLNFGVRITNKTSIPYRFDLPHILPDILDSNGKPIPKSGGTNIHRLVEESDIPLISSGESIDFFIDTKMCWYDKNSLQLLSNVYYGGVLIFWISKPGKYQIRFTYQNQLARKQMLTLKEGRTEVGRFWIGKVQTPLIDLLFR
jgi:hypothetical protein